MSFNTIHAVQEMILAQSSGGSQSPMGILPMVMMMVFAMYFVMIRPQQKRDRARRSMLDALSKGNEVITMGGIHGKIVGLDEDKVVVRISNEPLVKIELVRSSISHVVEDEQE